MGKMKELENEMIQRFNDTQENLKETCDNIGNMVLSKDSHLNETLRTGIEGVQKFVAGVAEDLHQKRLEVNAKYTRKFGKVKDVIAKYFEKYDVDMEELKINMKVLNQKYADWSKVLIEPTSLNEARLYALETRLHEEEEIRIKEQEYMRDLLKKLIFSLE